MTEPVKVSPASSHGEGRLVARNMAYLMAAQVLTLPLTVVLNGVYARYLGAADFGLLYLAWTMCGFGILIVEWGQAGVLPALIARDRSQAPVMLGTGFVWRGAAACVVYAFLAAMSAVLGNSERFQWVFAACFLAAILGSLGNGYKDAIRGFERTDVPAGAHVAQQVMLFLAVMAAVLLGGRLNALLCVGVLVPFLVLLGLSRVSKRVGIGPLVVRREHFAIMFAMGTPFVINDIAMSLQPIAEALFLSKLAPQEVVGWYAATRRLTGLLILPAVSLTSSLYPTLSRLHVTSGEGFATTVRNALNGVALLAAPAALGCGLFPEIGIAVFGAKDFAPAANNLRVMSAFLFLVYFSMPLTSAVLASGKRRAWTAVVSVSVVVSVSLDPFLVYWFQAHMGNGGVGLCVAAVVSECMVIIGGMMLVPRGVLDRSVLRTIALTCLSGMAMVVVALVLKGRVNAFVAAPIAVLAYVFAALATGAVTKQQREAVLGVLRRRLGRFFPK